MDEQNKFNQIMANEVALLIGRQAMELVKLQVQLQALAEAAKEQPEPQK